MWEPYHFARDYPFGDSWRGDKYGSRDDWYGGSGGRYGSDTWNGASGTRAGCPVRVDQVQPEPVPDGPGPDHAVIGTDSRGINISLRRSSK